MTNTARTIKNHSNIWTILLLVLAAYMLWPVIDGGDATAPDSPHELAEMQNEKR